MCGYVNLIKQNLRFSFPFTPVALPALSSYRELVVAVLQSAARERLQQQAGLWALLRGTSAGSLT